MHHKLAAPLSDIIVGIFHASIVDSVLGPRDKAYSRSPSSTHAYVSFAYILDSPSTSELKGYPVRQVEACQIGLGYVGGPTSRSNDGNAFWHALALNYASAEISKARYEPM